MEQIYLNACFLHFVSYAERFYCRSNNFTFDTSNMEKPYKIIIPKITLAPYGVVQSSKVIKLPIPKNGETINLNKEVVIEYNRDYGFNNENNSFKILNCQFKSDKLLMNH